MLGLVTLTILIHTIYSAARWRKFLTVSSESAPLPIDVKNHKHADYRRISHRNCAMSCCYPDEY